jgi:uncharacterized protein YbaR (Trm112 family)
VNPRLFRFLVCPGCKQDLTLSEAREKNRERIVEGTISCPSYDATYPIHKGIPRFVATDEYTTAFSCEWNRFRDVRIDILKAKDESEKTCVGYTGWNPMDLKGKTILDAGIGAGRFAEVVSHWGGEVIGMGLSFAVEAAYENVGARENVHILQADLFHPPFREDTFDEIYSIGVLHHTTDTKQAFDSLAPLLKKGVVFAVFLYAYGHYHFFSDLWRKITTRIPHRIAYYLSSLAIPLYYLYRLPGAGLGFRVGFPGWVSGLGFRVGFPMNQHPNPQWWWLDTYEWYTPKYSTSTPGRRSTIGSRKRDSRISGSFSHRGSIPCSISI